MTDLNVSIIREQLVEIEAMEKRLASMRRALHIALGDIQAPPKMTTFESNGKKLQIKHNGSKAHERSQAKTRR
jgi:hypothetical protein